jgi:hypothetical protein
MPVRRSASGIPGCRLFRRFASRICSAASPRAGSSLAARLEALFGHSIHSVALQEGLDLFGASQWTHFPKFPHPSSVFASAGELRERGRAAAPHILVHSARVGLKLSNQLLKPGVADAEFPCPVPARRLLTPGGETTGRHICGICEIRRRCAMVVADAFACAFARFRIEASLDGILTPFKTNSANVLSISLVDNAKKIEELAKRIKNLASLFLSGASQYRAVRHRFASHFQE